MSSPTPSPNPVILVTGTSRGLGLSITRLLLTHPTPLTVVTISRSPSPSNTNAVTLPNGTIHTHTHLQSDLSAPGGPKKAVGGAVQMYGRLDGVVVNHGVLEPVERVVGGEEGVEGIEGVEGERKGVEEEEEEGDGLDEWRRAWEVNFFSVVALCRASIPHLRRTRGRLLLISSGASQTGNIGWGCYSASKAALNSLCRTLSTEEPLITSICIRPGVIDTDMQKDIREKHGKAMGEGHERFVELHRTGRLLRPEVPGAVVVNLVLRGERELGGGYFSWDAPELRDYQGTVVPTP